MESISGILFLVSAILVFIGAIFPFKHHITIGIAGLTMMATLTVGLLIFPRIYTGTPKTSIEEGSYEVVEYRGGFVGKQQPCYYFLLKEKTYDSFYALPTFYAIPADSIKISPTDDFTKVNTLDVEKRRGLGVITLFTSH